MRAKMLTIDRTEIARNLDVTSLVDPVADAFVAFSAGESRSAIDVLHPTDHSDIHVKSAVQSGSDVFTVKLAGWSAANEANGLPASSGMIVVFDAASCRPIALLQDEHLISDLRTAAAGAIAAREMANPNIHTVGLLGAGEQAYRQIEALRLVRKFREVRLWNRNRERAVKLAARLGAEQPAVSVRVEETAQGVVEAADLLICATGSRDPLVKSEWLKPGVHITSVGSDDATKSELAPECFMSADIVVVDSVEAAQQFGNIHRAIQAGMGDLQSIIEIGDILRGAKVGRQSKEQITIVSFVGLGVQDLAAAKVLRKTMSF